MANVAGGERFEIGRALSGALSVLRRDAGTLIATALILYFLPVALIGWATAASVAAYDAFDGKPHVSPAWFFLSGFAGVHATGAVLSVATAYVAAMRRRGAPTTARRAIGRALRLAPHTVVLVALAYLAYALASVLLVFPAFLLAAMWLVAAPALIVERRGLAAAFTRSAVLTNGWRWKVFAVIAAYLVSLIFVRAAVWTAWIGLIGAAGDDAAFFIGSALFEPLRGAIVGALTGVGLGVVYEELRRAKEGAGPEAIAAVFG